MWNICFLTHLNFSSLHFFKLEKKENDFGKISVNNSCLWISTSCWNSDYKLILPKLLFPQWFPLFSWVKSSMVGLSPMYFYTWSCMSTWFKCGYSAIPCLEEHRRCWAMLRTRNYHEDGNSQGIYKPNSIGGTLHKLLLGIHYICIKLIFQGTDYIL